jgi:hypothetical protein
MLVAPTMGQITVNITNGSFENPAIPSGGFTEYQGGGTVGASGAAATPGWTATQADVLGIGDLTGAADQPQGAADGENALFFNADAVGSTATSTVYQDVSEAIVGGETYDLSVGVNQRQTLGVQDWLIQLVEVESSTTVAQLIGTQADVTPADPWDYFDLSWSAPLGSDGNTLRIVLGESNNTGIQVNFDDVTLTRTPEPTSVLLLGLGASFFLRRRRTA